MANSLDTFVKNVISQSVPEHYQEAAELNRKAVSTILEANVGNLDRVMEVLDVEKHTITFIAILLVKLKQALAKSTPDQVEEVVTQVETLLPLFEKYQISFVVDLYVELCQRLHICYLIKLNMPFRGIPVFANAIDRLPQKTKQLTSLHVCLFCLCLKARRTVDALPYLSSDISSILKETPPNTKHSVDSRWVLLFFYYGGLIFAVHDRFREALFMMKRVFLVNAFVASAIMVEAYKKYSLFSLLVHGKVIHIEGRFPQVVRALLPQCKLYSEIEHICGSGNEHPDKARELLNYLEVHLQEFSKDNNVGLVRRVARGLRENAIINLTKCFTSIYLDDLVRRCHLTSKELALRYLSEMNEQGKIRAKIDEENGVVYLDETRGYISEEKIDAIFSEAKNLVAQLTAYDDELRLNPSYLMRLGKQNLLGRAAAAGLPVDEGLGYQAGPSFAVPSASYSMEPGSARGNESID